MKQEFFITQFGIWYQGAKFEKIELDISSENVKKQIDAVINWSSSHCEHRKTINKKYSSYKLKHNAEDKMEIYITNGAFIYAMLKLGYRGQPTSNESQNMYFAASYL